LSNSIKLMFEDRYQSSDEAAGKSMDRTRRIVVAIYLILAFGAYFLSLFFSRISRIREFLGL
jgi:hypothetical protein